MNGGFNGFSYPPIWRAANIQLYLGSTLVTLDSAKTKQLYIRNNGVVVVQAVLIVGSGSPSGVAEIRNLPIKPFRMISTANAGRMIYGYGEWTNQGTNFTDVRLYCSDAQNGYFHFSQYDTYNDLNITMAAADADGLAFTLTYPCAP